VTLHPETGEHVLNISPLTLQHVVGMGAAEGEALLGEVTRHALGMGQRQLECMMRWALGAQDVIMWDNRATVHLAPVGLPRFGSVRQVFRVTCKGQPFLCADAEMGTSAVAAAAAVSRIVRGTPILSAREEATLGHA
jgi:taurine dioxygenase